MCAEALPTGLPLPSTPPQRGGGKLPEGMLSGSLDHPISTASCYTAWHPLEGFSERRGNIRVIAAQSTHLLILRLLL